MMKTQCILLWVCFFSVSYGNLVPFIDKCVWNDKACLIKSSNKALPHVCGGLPELGIRTLDPLVVKQVKVEESGLDIVFNDFKLTGLCNCKIINVERNVEESYILVQAECPIDVKGTYKASGNLLLVPVEGNGPFHVKSNKVFVSVKVSIKTVDGSDGQKFWKISKYEHSYDFKEKALLKFENLYNGDEEKAGPVINVLEQSWKDIVRIFAKPIVYELVHQIIHGLKELVHKIPVSDLEL